MGEENFQYRAGNLRGCGSDWQKFRPKCHRQHLQVQNSSSREVLGLSGHLGDSCGWPQVEENDDTAVEIFQEGSGLCCNSVQQLELNIVSSSLPDSLIWHLEANQQTKNHSKVMPRSRMAF